MPSIVLERRTCEMRMILVKLEEVMNGKNLKKLAGFIFMCNGKTKPKCYMYRVFGMPQYQGAVVEKIQPGMKLFLFDFEVKLLYGIYEATSCGKLNLEPAAFGGSFPAQVKFKIYKDCLPVPESSFRYAIQDNSQEGKFQQELNEQQVRSLLFLFRPLSVPGQKVPHPIAFHTPQEHNSGLTFSHNTHLVEGHLGHSRRHSEPQHVKQSGLLVQFEGDRTHLNRGSDFLAMSPDLRTNRPLSQPYSNFPASYCSHTQPSTEPQNIAKFLVPNDTSHLPASNFSHSYPAIQPQTLPTPSQQYYHAEAQQPSLVVQPVADPAIRSQIFPALNGQYHSAEGQRPSLVLQHVAGPAFKAQTLPAQNGQYYHAEVQQTSLLLQPMADQAIQSQTLPTPNCQYYPPEVQQPPFVFQHVADPYNRLVGILVYYRSSSRRILLSITVLTPCLEHPMLLHLLSYMHQQLLRIAAFPFRFHISLAGHFQLSNEVQLTREPPRCSHVHDQ